MTGDDSATKFYEAAVAAHSQGRVAEAEQAYVAVLRQDPAHHQALHGLGVLCLQTGRHDSAIAHLRKAVAASGGSAIVRNNLAVALCAARRFPEAAEIYREALGDEPDSVPAMVNLGKILNLLGEYREAVGVLQPAVTLAANHAEAHHQYARALAGAGNTVDALVHLERAAALAPGKAELQCELGDLLGETGRHEEAAACFQRAVGLAPGFAPAYHNLGTALTYLGRLKDANRAFSRAVEIEPANPAFRRAMLGAGKIARDDPHLKALENIASAGRLDPGESIAVPFALAKAYDDMADYGRAFSALQTANGARRKLSRYDVQSDLERFRAIAAAFSADFMASHAGEGAPGEVPVFVVGMPRSGTSLVEQIIASHPQVFGAGEQTIMPALINLGRAGPAFPSAVAGLSNADFRTFGETYAKELCALAPQALRITDKLPLNFQLVGLIRLALPRARVVHVVRDPMDTCFSCYSVLFDDDLDFTLDLADLGRYYRGYQALMAHWRAVLPPGAMFELAYEDLVATPESEVRKLIAYCGLEWDERCLSFHETVRTVETASAHQVRRPLYATSVGRAAHYAQWLEPLRRALAGEES